MDSHQHHPPNRRATQNRRATHFSLFFLPLLLERRALMTWTHFVVVISLFVSIIPICECQYESSTRSQPRFDFSSFNQRRQLQQPQSSLQYQQPLSLPNNVNNNHHFQRQQLNSGADPLHSASSPSASNTNANFNSHFTRPYVRSPSSHENFYGHSRNGAFGSEPDCGYNSCHETNPNSLNIHVVCHTHLDTGWVETYDEYYHHCEYPLLTMHPWRILSIVERSRCCFDETWVCDSQPHIR